MTPSADVSKSILNALVSSIYVSAIDPGLPVRELEEVATTLGYMHSELHDIMRTLLTMRVHALWT